MDVFPLAPVNDANNTPAIPAKSPYTPQVMMFIRLVLYPESASPFRLMDAASIAFPVLVNEMNSHKQNNVNQAIIPIINPLYVT